MSVDAVEQLLDRRAAALDRYMRQLPGTREMIIKTVRIGDPPRYSGWLCALC